jgi:hypothetical protein
MSTVMSRAGLLAVGAHYGVAHYGVVAEAEQQVLHSAIRRTSRRGRFGPR